jgi:hypothetical protein
MNWSTRQRGKGGQTQTSRSAFANGSCLNEVAREMALIAESDRKTTSPKENSPDYQLPRRDARAGRIWRQLPSKLNIE